MNGALALPMICPRSWFSMTIVNTEPVHCAGRVAGLTSSARHWVSVLPELFGAQAVPAMATLVMRRALILRMGQVCTRAAPGQGGERHYWRHTPATAARVQKLPVSLALRTSFAPAHSFRVSRLVSPMHLLS